MPINTYAAGRASPFLRPAPFVPQMLRAVREVGHLKIWKLRDEYLRVLDSAEAFLETVAIKDEQARFTALDNVGTHVVERCEADPATETLLKLGPNLKVGNLYKERELAIGLRHGGIRVNFESEIKITIRANQSAFMRYPCER